jgi:hypothetical protein
MSTENSKKKRRFSRFDRIKIIEYACIALVILLFIGLSVYYANKKGQSDRAEPTAELSPSPVPTKDPSIRGMNVLEAIDTSDFKVNVYPDHYDIVYPDETKFCMRMDSDDRGIRELYLETLLCADPEDDTLTAEMIRDENRRTVAALQDLLDRILPVFHRTVSDSNTIVKSAQKVVKDGVTYTKHLGTYSVSISSDPEAAPQSVVIRLIRD